MWSKQSSKYRLPGTKSFCSQASIIVTFLSAFQLIYNFSDYK